MVLFRRLSNCLTLPLLLLATPILSAYSDPIVGGEDVASTDVLATSTVALLTVTPRGVGTCTGSLISQDLLVTAAHCVSDPNGKAYPGDRMYLVFNVGVQAGIGERRRAIAAMPHPKYQGVFGTGKDLNDIAIVRFPGGLPVGYEPATLLPAKSALLKGAPTTLIGYGVDQMDPLFGGSGAGTLRKVTVKIHDPKFGKTEVLLDQRQGKGACHGDSGGPATVTSGGKIYLWGVTNRGYPEDAPDDCKHFSVYTRITAHQNFITQAVSLLRQLK